MSFLQNPHQIRPLSPYPIQKFPNSFHPTSPNLHLSPKTTPLPPMDAQIPTRLPFHPETKTQDDGIPARMSKSSPNSSPCTTTFGSSRSRKGPTTPLPAQDSLTTPLPVHGWELDPCVIGVGRQYFGLSQLERQYTDRLIIHVGDAFKASTRGGSCVEAEDSLRHGKLIKEMQRVFGDKLFVLSEGNATGFWKKL